MSVEKNNTGFATKNKFATTDKHPKFKGIVNVDGKQYEIAIWERLSKKDEKPYLSMTFQTEEEANKYKKDNSTTGETQQFNKDDLPF